MRAMTVGCCLRHVHVWAVVPGATLCGCVGDGARDFLTMTSTRPVPCTGGRYWPVVSVKSSDWGGVWWSVTNVGTVPWGAVVETHGV